MDTNAFFICTLMCHTPLSGIIFLCLYSSRQKALKKWGPQIWGGCGIQLIGALQVEGGGTRGGREGGREEGGREGGREG